MWLAAIDLSPANWCYGWAGGKHVNLLQGREFEAFLTLEANFGGPIYSFLGHATGVKFLVVTASLPVLERVFLGGFSCAQG